jgi:hypothetical protein
VRTTRRGVIAAVSTGVTLAAAGVSAPAGAAGRQPHWRIDAVPLNAVLYDTASIGADVWAVGATVTNNFETLALRWEGGRWVTVAVPDAAGSRFDGIDGVDAADVWAVGSTGHGSGVVRSLISHWDGQRWTAVSTQDEPGLYTDLVRVDAVSPNDAWAVGNQVGPDFRHGVVRHWDGVRWSQMRLPDLGDYSLSAVTAVGPKDVWVGGRSYSENQPLVLHWDGRSWIRADLPLIKGADWVTIESITVSSRRDVSALGFTQWGGIDSRRPLGLHFDGLVWTTAATPDERGHFIDAVRWRGDTWAVGYGETPSFYQRGADRWASLPAPDIQYAAFFSVTAVPGRGLLAVGAAPGPDDASSFPLIAWYR